MAKDHDFKRLVRERMQDTGERYTEARARWSLSGTRAIRSSATGRAASWASSRTSASRR